MTWSSAASNVARVSVRFVDVEDKNLQETLAAADGILVPGGFGDRGIEGKIASARFARERHVPFFGICLGMQVAVIEAGRNLLGFKMAGRTGERCWPLLRRRNPW